MTDTAKVQRVSLGGKRFVILGEREYERLAAKAGAIVVGKKRTNGKRARTEVAPDKHGYYKATDAIRAVLGRKIVERRERAGLTQARLASLAGVRVETISRLETGKNAPNVRTVDRIDSALRRAGV
jgi:DNA-binding XRE family transcriptional regulator